MMPRAVCKRKGCAVAIESLEERRLLSAAITLINPDGLPDSGTQLAFNRIQNPNTSINEVTHDTNTLDIENTGDTPLIINKLTLSDTTNWQLVNSPVAGTSISPGANIDVTIKFIAQSVPPNQPTDETNDTISIDNLPPSQTGGVWDGTLTISSSDPNHPTSTVQLAGYWQDESEHEEEPNTQTLVNRLLGYGTVIDDISQPQYPNNGSKAVLYGEEVASGYWQSADPSQSVNVLQVFAYHNEVNEDDGQSPTAQIGWFTEGSGSVNVLFAHAAGHSQSLLPPLINTTNAPAQGSFTTNNVFGFNVDGESSVDSQNTVDINDFARSGHALRFYPLRDSDGNVIPNTWLLVMDYQNGSYDNSDFQDNGYIISNVRPVTQAPAPTGLEAIAAANGQVSLSWTGVIDTSLKGYNVYRSTSANGTFHKLNASLISGNSFTDASPPGSTVFYQVSAVDDQGESEKSDASVGVSAADGVSDLAAGPVSGPSLKSSMVAGASTGPLKLTIANQGAKTAAGTVRIDLYLSPTQNTVPSGAVSMQHVIRAINLKPGRSMAVAIPGFRIPATLSAQDFIVAQFTSLKGITETNTGNNTNSTASSIKIAAPFVDLQNLYTGSPPAIVPGKRAALIVPIINNGNIAAHGIATITITASTNSSGSGGTTMATIKRPILLAAGKTAKLNLGFLVPTLASGHYFVVTNVNLPADTNAANNIAAGSSTFTV